MYHRNLRIAGGHERHLVPLQVDGMTKSILGKCLSSLEDELLSIIQFAAVHEHHLVPLQVDVMMTGILGKSP